MPIASTSLAIIDVETIDVSSTIGPEMPTHCWNVPAWAPPSWSSTTIASTLCCCSCAAAALADSTSSLNDRPPMPRAATSSGVPSSVMPMKPTFTPSTTLVHVGGRTVSPVSSNVTLAASHGNAAPS